ncbi:MAG: GntR family transcriptional regulator [Candidatus Melainabacteria bacterium]|nr:GntR family transcriptional regulator [Candidatus Melainabacteria bacterium]
MKIQINKESPVSIRDQLIEQISLQIASGALSHEDKLPSIRALAARLDIHYSTITSVYNHLADVGLLEVRQGSGVRVASLKSSQKKSGSKEKSSSNNSVDAQLDSMINEFLVDCCDFGLSQEQVLEKFKGFIARRKPLKQIVVIDRNPDFHPVWLTELKPNFSLPVKAITIEDFKSNPDILGDSLVVTSLYHLFAFQSYVKDKTRLVPCNIEPARAELEEVGKMRSGSLIMLVSASETLMKMASKLIAAQRGNDVAVRTILLKDKTEWQYTFEHADLILCDTQSKDEVTKFNKKGKKVLPFSLCSNATIALIQDRIAKWG